MSYSQLYDMSYQMRLRYLEIFTKIGYGQLPSCFSLTEILITLYMNIMELDNVKDSLILSKGHGAGMVYPILEKKGLITAEELDDFLTIGSDKTIMRKFFMPSFEFYGGTLGMGLGLASGLSMGKRLNRDKSLTFCIMGDAETYEGSVWESALFAGSNRLNSLVVIVDRNQLGASEFTEQMVVLEPYEERWKSYGFETIRVNGHSYEELIPALLHAKERRNTKPLCIIANTIKGKGLDYLYNNPLYHAYMPNTEKDIGIAFKELKFDAY